MEQKKNVATVSQISEASKALKSPQGLSKHDFKESFEYDKKIADNMAKIYEEHNGDIKSIFEALHEIPRKALKHPPKDAHDFGVKYAQGFYYDIESK